MKKTKKKVKKKENVAWWIRELVGDMTYWHFKGWLGRLLEVPIEIENHEEYREHLVGRKRREE